MNIQKYSHTVWFVSGSLLNVTCPYTIANAGLETGGLAAIASASIPRRACELVVSM
jgi:hypothetical protein